MSKDLAVSSRIPAVFVRIYRAYVTHEQRPRLVCTHTYQIILQKCTPSMLGRQRVVVSGRVLRLWQLTAMVHRFVRRLIQGQHEHP